MRQSIYIAIVSLMLLVSSAFAQNDFGNYSADGSYVSSGNAFEQKPTASPRGKISQVEKKWYVGDTQVEPSAVEVLLNSNPEAASEYSTGKMFYYPGLVFAALGGGAIGYGVVAWINGDSDIGMPLTLGGVGVCGLAFLLNYIAGTYSESAIEIYNKSIDNENSVSLKIAPTPQGGLALALAF